MKRFALLFAALATVALAQAQPASTNSAENNPADVGAPVYIGGGYNEPSDGRCNFSISVPGLSASIHYNQQSPGCDQSFAEMIKQMKKSSGPSPYTNELIYLDRLVNDKNPACEIGSRSIGFAGTVSAEPIYDQRCLDVSRNRQ